jgi:hypothetical protein
MDMDDATGEEEDKARQEDKDQSGQPKQAKNASDHNPMSSRQGEQGGKEEATK